MLASRTGSEPTADEEAGGITDIEAYIFPERANTNPQVQTFIGPVPQAATATLESDDLP